MGKIIKESDIGKYHITLSRIEKDSHFNYIALITSEDEGCVIHHGDYITGGIMGDFCSANDRYYYLKKIAKEQTNNINIEEITEEEINERDDR